MHVNVPIDRKDVSGVQIKLWKMTFAENVIQFTILYPYCGSAHMYISKMTLSNVNCIKNRCVDGGGGAKGASLPTQTYTGKD